MKNKISKTLLVLLLLASSAFIGCVQKQSGAFESAGERTDEIIDNVKEGKPLLHKKGTLEKTGEAIDETINPKE